MPLDGHDRVALVLDHLDDAVRRPAHDHEPVTELVDGLVVVRVDADLVRDSAGRTAAGSDLRRRAPGRPADGRVEMLGYVLMQRSPAQMLMTCRPRQMPRTGLPAAATASRSASSNSSRFGLHDARGSGRPRRRSEPARRPSRRSARGRRAVQRGLDGRRARQHHRQAAGRGHLLSPPPSPGGHPPRGGFTPLQGGRLSLDVGVRAGRSRAATPRRRA